MRYLAGIALALLPSIAAAQTGPSFDCAKATSAIDRTICSDADLAGADREMAQLYAALSGRLTGPAKESLQKGQVEWIVGRNRGCAGSDADAMQLCLKRRYGERIADLKASGTGAYPFVEARWIEKKGKVGKVSYSIAVNYPRFLGKTANFAAINKAYADAAIKGSVEATPTADSGVDREQDWSAEGGYSLHRPGADAVAVQLRFWAYTGGAHGYGSISCTLVDLRTGKWVGPGGVFVAGDQWHREVLALVTADLKKQFKENPGFDDALQPDALGKMLRDDDRYCWHAHQLLIYFNQYDVGPYSAGPYQVVIPYSRLRALIRADGPVAR